MGIVLIIGKPVARCSLVQLTTAEVTDRKLAYPQETSSAVAGQPDANLVGDTGLSTPASANLFSLSGFSN